MIPVLHVPGTCYVMRDTCVRDTYGLDVYTCGDLGTFDGDKKVPGTLKIVYNKKLIEFNHLRAKNKNKNQKNNLNIKKKLLHTITHSLYCTFYFIRFKPKYTHVSMYV